MTGTDVKTAVISLSVLLALVLVVYGAALVMSREDRQTCHDIYYPEKGDRNERLQSC